MTKIISIVVIIVVITLIFVGIKDKPTSENDTDMEKNMENTQASSSPVSIPEISIDDGIYTLDEENSSLNWTGRKIILKNWIDKGIIDLEEVIFEVKDNVIVSNKFVIDMATITGQSTGKGKDEDRLTTHLKSADFFDVETYPTSVFMIKELKKASSTSSFVAIGDLTIKGKTNEISIPVDISYSEDTINIKGSADVDRTLWDVRYGSDKFFDNLGDNIIDDIFNLSFDINLVN